MLQTRGTDIINEKGEKIILRGQNIGIWLLIEPNMFGTPGVEHRLRRAMKIQAGEEKTEYFFKQFNDKWVTEKDIAFLADMGCNSIRLPINYRYLESDNEPFKYLERGFELIDRMIGYCKKHSIYVVIDLHAIQGYQNGDFPSDNIFSEQVNFYYDGMCQKRFIELWKEIARRYKDEEWVAGYDLINEAVAVDKYEVEVLNRIYRETTKAIREIDEKHIIFIGGNNYCQDFSEMEEPFADNLVYKPHYYNIAATRKSNYPNEVIDGVLYNKEKMERDMDYRDAYMKKYNVPCWIGEFGVRRFPDLDGKDQALKDYLSVIEERGHSWCYWDFKDMNLRGPLYINPESEWTKFLKDISELKQKYNTDRSNVMGNEWDLSSVFKEYKDGDFVQDRKEIEELLVRNMRETLADALTMKFGEMFSKLSYDQIDKITDSFKFENCMIYHPWAEIFKSIN